MKHFLILLFTIFLTTCNAYLLFGAPLNSELNTINTTFQNLNQFKQRTDSIRLIQFTRIDGNIRKVKIIKEHKYLIIKTTDSLSFKGKISIINKDSIQINENILPIAKIRLIKKPVLSTLIIGNTFGYLFTVLSVGLFESQGVEEGLTVAPLALPFYSMNFIRRRFNLETKWKAEVKFEKNNDRKKVFGLN
jgi:hypothetical protein